MNELEYRQPYPGLRPFGREDTDLFFGREDCADALVDLLSKQRFLAVLGSSGSGKSSLVRSGLLYALQLGLMAKAGRWRIVDFRPGEGPLRNLARGLLRSGGGDASPQEVDSLRTFLTRGPRSVIEWCHDGHLASRENLLLLADQFEELFRYHEYAGREEAEAFVALLLESSKPNSGAPIYVVLTMRSEYLGACALMEGLAERMNGGQFLTPRMTREQCREAIEGPAAVCGVKIEPALVNELLNELSSFAPWEESAGSNTLDQLDRLARRADQLPLLQHVLNRMWVRAAGAAGTAVGLHPLVLRLADYVEIGGLQGAIDRHADEVLTALGEERRQTAKSVFRALTAGGSVADAVRRPTTFKTLVAVNGGNEAGVRLVIDAFRASRCNFLLPESSAPIAPDTWIDISHETVIRQWGHLSSWVKEEAHDRQQLGRLIDAAGLERQREGGLLHGLTLEYLLDWRKSANPTLAWADRYAPQGAFDQAMSFLDRSRDALLASRRKRFYSIGAGVLAAILIAGVIGYDYEARRVAEAAAIQARLEADTASEARMKLALVFQSSKEDYESSKKEAERKLTEALARTTHISNEDILLNIVRASKSEPLSLGGQAFLQPFDLTTLNYFIREDYSSELLLWLFTDSIEITIAKRGTIGFQFNPPSDYGCPQQDPRKRCFREWIELMTVTGLSVDQRTEKTADGGGGGDSKGKPSGGVGGSERTVSRFCFDDVLARRGQSAMEQASPGRLQLLMAKYVDPGALQALSPKCGSPWPKQNLEQVGPDTLKLNVGPLQFQFLPRSAYGVYQFLGKILRQTNADQIPDYIRHDELRPELSTVREDKALLNIVSGSPGGCFVESHFEGGNYCVPQAGSFNTKRIFDLLAQLFALGVGAGDR